jgi:hypothetical protein
MVKTMKKRSSIMRNFFKLFGFIALVAVIGISFIACDNDSGAGSGGGESVPAVPTGLTATAYSSNAITINWNAVPGATGYKVYNGATSAVTYVGTVYSNSAFNNDLPSSTTVYYRVTAINSQGESGMSDLAYATTLSTGNYSLNGVWEQSNGEQITVNGSTGTWSKFWNPPNALTQSAIDKGYLRIGDQVWRNIRSTGNLTWSGEGKMITFNSSSPNVATGTSWTNCTFVMGANGQTVVRTYTDSSGQTRNITYTRK